MSGEKIVIPFVGPLGSGKTTIAERVAGFLGVPLYKEIPPETNPALQKFYEYFALETAENPHNPYALVAQKGFLVPAIQQGIEIAQSQDEVVVWEMPPQGHRMYAQDHYHKGRMNHYEWLDYLSLYDQGREQMADLSVIFVILIRDAVAHFQRVNDRGRAIESHIPTEYLQGLAAHWIDQVDHQPPNGHPKLVEVDALAIDWRTQAGLLEVIDIFRQYVPGFDHWYLRKITANLVTDYAQYNEG